MRHCTEFEFCIVHGKTTLAIGAEPQILGGEKRGPLGTGSESLKDQSGKKVGAMCADTASIGIREVLDNVEEQAKGLVKWREGFDL